MVDKLVMVIKQDAAVRTSVLFQPQMYGFKMSFSSPVGLKTFPTLATSDSSFIP